MNQNDMSNIFLQRRRLAFVLWFTFLISVAITCGVAMMLALQPPQRQPIFDDFTAQLLLAAAVVVGCLSLWLYRYRGSDGFIQSVVAKESVKSGEHLLVDLQLRFITLTIINGALNEAVAIIGFVASFGTLRAGPALYTAIGALLLLMVMRPDDRRIVERGRTVLS